VVRVVADVEGLGAAGVARMGKRGNPRQRRKAAARMALGGERGGAGADAGPADGGRPRRRKDP